jgi:hypothetical protein
MRILNFCPVLIRIARTAKAYRVIRGSASGFPTVSWGYHLKFVLAVPMICENHLRKVHA